MTINTHAHSNGKKLLILGVVLIAAGLALLLVFPPKTILVKVLFAVVAELGFALVIAWGVAYMIESKSRDEYDHYTQVKAKLISKNVFGYLYGVHLPRKVFDVIEKHIFKPRVIKTDQRLDYQLVDPETADAEWIKMRCEYDYVLANYSDKPFLNYPVRFYNSDPTDREAPSMDGLGLQALIIGEENIPRSDFANLDKAAPNSVGVRNYEKHVDIPAHGSVRVQVTFVQVKRVTDNDLYQTHCLTERFELKLRYDPSVYEAFIETVHAQKEFDRDIPAHDGSCCHTVVLETALLPGNGVFMWWGLKQKMINKDEANLIEASK